MRSLFRFIANIYAIRSESGVTAVEYGLIAALISVVIMTVLSLIGTRMSTMFTFIAHTV